MKKIISMLLITGMILSLASCGKDAETVSNPENEVQQNVENNEAENDINAGDENTADKEEEKPVTQNQEKPQAKPQTQTQSKPQTKPQTQTESQAKPQENPAPAPENKPAELPETNPEPTPAPENKPAEKKSVGNTLLSAFKEKASSSNALSLAESLCTNPVIPFSCMAVPVEPGYLTGFDNTEIKGFKEGAMFGPMIGTHPFVGYVFTLEDSKDVSAFISTLKSSANLRWNICTQADEMVSGSVGNKVFFVMSPISFDEE